MPKDLRAGFPVHWQALSNAGAPGLLLHCALAYSGAYAGLAAALDGVLALTAADMPGHGRSDDWDGRRDIHDQITDSAATFLQPGTHLIGHSFGATVALRLAQEHPDQIASLTLIEPVLFAAARESDPEAWARHKAVTLPFDEALAARDWPLAAQVFTADWGDGRAWDALPERQRAGFVARIPLIAETNRALNEDTAGLLAPERSSRVTCPTRLLRGANTMPIVAVIHRALMALLPNASEAVIDGAGHMLPLSHPDAVARQIAGQLTATNAPI